MELFNILIGFAMLYVLLHGFILHFLAPAFPKRSSYEKFVTLASGVAIMLCLLTLMQ